MKKGLTQDQINDYLAGQSVNDLAENSDLSPSAIRARLEQAGVLRSRTDATRLSLLGGKKLRPISRFSASEVAATYAAQMSQLWLQRPIMATNNGL
jgi:hypothetical protein